MSANCLLRTWLQKTTHKLRCIFHPRFTQYMPKDPSLVSQSSPERTTTHRLRQTSNPSNPQPVRAQGKQ
eukprot:767136-Hanusia_phi.AAC.5